jgi:hypothetical protein
VAAPLGPWGQRLRIPPKATASVPPKRRAPPNAAGRSLKTPPRPSQTPREARKSFSGTRRRGKLKDLRRVLAGEIPPRAHSPVRREKDARRARDSSPGPRGRILASRRPSPRKVAGALKSPKRPATPHSGLARGGDGEGFAGFPRKARGPSRNEGALWRRLARVAARGLERMVRSKPRPSLSAREGRGTF